MKIIDTIVVHSKRENEDRLEITNWCIQTFGNEGWWINSDYREEGCFKITFTSSKDAEFYIMRWGGMILEIIYKSEQVLQVDEEVFARLFEIK